MNFLINIIISEQKPINEVSMFYHIQKVMNKFLLCEFHSVGVVYKKNHC